MSSAQARFAALMQEALAGDWLATVCGTDGGTPQRWFVLESEEPKQADRKQWDKTLAKATTHWQSQLRQWCAPAFAGEAETPAALEHFEQQ